ncbi:hypothetical protein SAMN04489713_110269 [Actinomadura madurae]|uniref:Uncharacterized protein n=1 Tax=Actinomadura madurae TaxID=1993 RepID=A0A1I5L692_9ACTN|nr:hypothetical protein [Actinomadura madurae]SFO92820.1 hypothetical protein SAMN04489713_110269 [Actinomadura madurae]
MQTDRPTAVREAIYALRGAQMHGQRYIPKLLERIAKGELSTRHLATHEMPLDDAPHLTGAPLDQDRLRTR